MYTTTFLAASLIGRYIKFIHICNDFMFVESFDILEPQNAY